MQVAYLFYVNLMVRPFNSYSELSLDTRVYFFILLNIKILMSVKIVILCVILTYRKLGYKN
jgi:hypothetical protein